MRTKANNPGKNLYEQLQQQAIVGAIPRTYNMR